VLAGFASADTIYLKNGRVIHTESAKQVGDKVEFIQFGQTVSIPASVVLRIEEDGRAEEPRPASPPSATPAPGAPEREAPADTSGETSDEDEAEEDVESTAEYWRGRVTAIEDEKDTIAEQIVRLRREERAFLFSKRSTKEIRERIEAAQARDKELDQELIDLRREARRRGIPPGWLRASPGTTGS
jgi:hypothetical protein